MIIAMISGQGLPEPVSLLVATFLLPPKDALRQKSAHPFRFFLCAQKTHTCGLIGTLISAFTPYASLHLLQLPLDVISLSGLASVLASAPGVIPESTQKNFILVFQNDSLFSNASVTKCMYYYRRQLNEPNVLLFTGSFNTCISNLRCNIHTTICTCLAWKNKHKSSKFYTLWLDIKDRHRTSESCGK